MSDATAGDVFYIITVALSAISTVISFGACFLYHIYSRDKNGRLLRMITLLVFADGVSSLCFTAWYILNALDFMDEDLLCSLIWPLQLFSFLCAFGLIILIATRFKRINTGQSQKEHLNVSLLIVPLVAFLLTLPTLIIDQAVQSTNITELISNTKKDRNEFCFYNSSVIGTMVNYVCLQLPSLLTIIYNIDAYRKGVHSLKASSSEVQKKSRYKAGKYLFVLLVVWIPSLIVHAYHSLISRANEPYFPVLIVILLTSCQGIFNALAYAWEYYPFRQWVYESILHLPYVIDDSPPAPFAAGIYRKAKPSSSTPTTTSTTTTTSTPTPTPSAGVSSTGNRNLFPVVPGSMGTPLLGADMTYGGEQGPSDGVQWEPTSGSNTTNTSNTSNTNISAASKGIKSTRRNHLTTGERNVRFGPDSLHRCSVYDDDDEDDADEGMVEIDANLEESVEEVSKSVYKFLKGIIRGKGKNKSQNKEKEKKVAEQLTPIPIADVLDLDEVARELELDRNTGINGASDFFTTRRREKKRDIESGRTRSRSPSRSRSRSRSVSPASSTSFSSKGRGGDSSPLASDPLPPPGKGKGS